MSNFEQAPPLPREPTLIRDERLTATQPTSSPSNSPPPTSSPPFVPPSPLPFPQVHDTPDQLAPVPQHSNRLSPKPPLPPKFPKFHPQIVEPLHNQLSAPSPTPPPAPAPAPASAPASAPAAAPPSPSPPPPPPPPPPPSKPPKDEPKEMPLPPKFPPIHDEPDWTTPKPTAPPAPSSHPNQPSPLASSSAQPNSDPSPSSHPLPEVSWNRVSSDNLSASLSQPPIQPEERANSEQSKGMLAKILALLNRKKTQPEEPVENVSPSKPPIQKVKEIVCKLPDPTLIFVLQASVILLIHTFAPHVLRSWPARILVPLLLVPTVAATALWRRTVVIARPGRTILSLVKPIPNAGMVVNMGETLRAREAAVLAAEERVREGQMRLEMLRKEIEARLPPQESIASLLESDEKAQEAS